MPGVARHTLFASGSKNLGRIDPPKRSEVSIGHKGKTADRRLTQTLPGVRPSTSRAPHRWLHRPPVPLCRLSVTTRAAGQDPRRLKSGDHPEAAPSRVPGRRRNGSRTARPPTVTSTGLSTDPPRTAPQAHPGRRPTDSPLGHVPFPGVAGLAIADPPQVAIVLWCTSRMDQLLDPPIPE